MTYSCCVQYAVSFQCFVFWVFFAAVSTLLSGYLSRLPTLILLEQLIFFLAYPSSLYRCLCVALLSGDSCAHGLLLLVESGVGGWEVIHSKSGGHKT